MNKNVKCLLEGEEIEFGVEVVFCDDYQWVRVVGEVFWQVIFVEKNVVSFFQIVVIGKVNIVEILGNRCIFSVEFQVGGLYGVLFYVSYLNYKVQYDFNDVCLRV